MCGGMTTELSAQAAQEVAPSLAPVDVTETSAPVEEPVKAHAIAAAEDKTTPPFDEKTTVFVAPLDPRTDAQQLREHFATTFGTVHHALVKYDVFTGQPKGFGFVQFEDVESAEKAVEAAATRMLDRDVSIRAYTAPGADKGKGKGGEGSYRNPNIPHGEGGDQTLFVGGLPREATEEDLSGYFRQYGEVTSATIKIDAATGNSRGFGFVTFRLGSTVDMCLEKASQHTVKDKWVDVKRYGGAYDARAWQKEQWGKGWGAQYAPVPVAPDRDPNSLFLGGLPQGITEELLLQYFGQFGKAKSVTIKKNPSTGLPRGFGFVIYEDAAGVSAALAARDSHMIMDKWIDVKKPAAQMPSQPFAKGKGKGKGKGQKGGFGYNAYGYSGSYYQQPHSQHHSSWGAYGAGQAANQSFVQYPAQYEQPMMLPQPMQQQQQQHHHHHHQQQQFDQCMQNGYDQCFARVQNGYEHAPAESMSGLMVEQMPMDVPMGSPMSATCADPMGSPMSTEAPMGSPIGSPTSVGTFEQSPFPADSAHGGPFVPAVPFLDGAQGMDGSPMAQEQFGGVQWYAYPAQQQMVAQY